MCDCATGVMVYMEVQEGKKHMCGKNAAEHGVSTACVRRMAEGKSNEDMTLLGDAWFGSVKVREAVRKLSLSCFMGFPMRDVEIIAIMFHGLSYLHP
jgi:hypothetical protein